MKKHLLLLLFALTGSLFTMAQNGQFGNVPLSSCIGKSATFSGIGLNTTHTTNVYTVVQDAAGNLYIGGSFTEVNGTPANRVAMYNGTTWSAMGDGFDNTVEKLAFDNSGKLYAVGRFQNSGSTQARRIASWNGTAWEEVGGGANNILSDIKFDGSNTLYVVGPATIFAPGAQNFASLGTAAKFNGTTWSSVGPPVSPNAIEIVGNKIYLTCDGDTGTDGNVYWVAYFDGTSWSNLGTGTEFTNTPNLATVTADASGNVYVGGKFNLNGSARHLARWDGTSWSAISGISLGTIPGNPTYIYDLALTSTGELFVGLRGFGTSIQGVNTNFAKWTGSAWEPIANVFGNIFHLFLNAENDVYAAGVNTGGLNIYGVAKYDAPFPVTATLTDALGLDMNTNGQVNPGDKLSYTLTITNGSTTTAVNGVVVNLTPDTNTELEVGAVNTTSGTVTTGNTAGDTNLSVAVGTIAANSTATITFNATVKTTISTFSVAQSASISSTANSFSTFNSDDPDDTSSACDNTATTVFYPIISLKGNNVAIAKGSTTTSTANGTDFGRFEVNTTSPAQEFVIENTGNTDLIFTPPMAVTISEESPTFFSLANLPTGPVAPTGTTSFNIEFTPTRVTPRTATVRIFSNAGTFSFDIFGRGGLVTGELAAALQTDQNNDGIINPGDVLRYTATISNLDTSVKNGIQFNLTPEANTLLTVGSVTTTQGTVTTGNTTGDTEIAVNIGDIAASTTVTITFDVVVNPAGGFTSVANSGAVSGTAITTVNTNEVTSTVVLVPEIAITGNGADIVSGSTTPITANFTDYGAIPLNTTLTRTFTIANQGTADLTLGANAVSLVQAAGNPFTVTQQPGTSVTPGQTTTFTIRFAATAPGEQTAVVIVLNNDSDEAPFTFSIKALGGNPEIFPSVTTLSGLSGNYSTASGASSYTINSENLIGNLEIAASGVFELSLDNSTFSKTLNIDGATASATDQTIYVRLADYACESASVSGTITHTSTQADTKTVNVSGTVGTGTYINTPFTFNRISNGTQVIISWADNPTINPSGATYDLLRAENDICNEYTVIQTGLSASGGTVTSAADNVTVGTLYYYKVRFTP